jgi:hypothetical protein
MLMHSSIDQFGFYTVGNLKFYSKFDAAEVSARSGQPLHWHFNDDVFSRYDWTKEPIQSLTEIYKQRAQQLREKYDYLVLWYSSGSDSDNILRSFVDNNIQLDEVASYTNLEATGDRNDWLNGEIYNVAGPRIQKIKETSQPWLKHTIIDLSKIIMDFFNNKVNKFDWIYNINSYLSPNNIIRTNIVEYHPDWLRLMDQGKRVGFIWGVEKPKIVGINGKFSTMFMDIIDGAVTPHLQFNPRPGLFHELFYWAPDCPEMVIKQCHVIKKFLKTVAADSPLLTDKGSSRYSVITIQGKIKYLTTNGTNQLIYPGWEPAPFQVKPQSLVFSPRDEWFFSLPDSDIAKHNWKQGIEYFWLNTPKQFKNDPNVMSRGFKTINSQIYDIGT